MGIVACTVASIVWDQLFRQPLAEIVLILLRTHVGEWQDGDGGHLWVAGGLSC